jgi:NADPH:quinone reductase-like Zn-dependent oxidoreductase
MSMRALRFEAFDGVGALRLAEGPASHPAAGEVLLDVNAAAFSFIDRLTAALSPASALPTRRRLSANVAWPRR